MPLIGPARPRRGWGAPRDWLGMREAKALRSSWEFVVVGLDFLFCFLPTTAAGAAGPSGHSHGLKTADTLVGLAPGGMHREAATVAVCEALFRTPCITHLDLPFPFIIVRAFFCSISRVSSGEIAMSS